jgi:hypothetical protein
MNISINSLTSTIPVVGLLFFCLLFPLVKLGLAIQIFHLKINTMKKIKFNQAFMLLLTLITLGFTASSFTTRFGLDSYAIYLNDQLILKQTVNQPLSLRVLPLGTAKETDQLRIDYTHCTIKNGAGTSRSVSLQDEKGNILKKWVFADATGSDLNMAIAVKELLALAKTHASQALSLHYTARELPKGEMLSMLQL